MPTYVSLVNWTDQGVKNYHETVARAEHFREIVHKAGGQVRELLWTLGEYDIVVVMEAPDDEAAMAAVLESAGFGNTRSQTMRAMGPDEVTSVIQRIS